MENPDIKNTSSLMLVGCLWLGVILGCAGGRTDSNANNPECSWNLQQPPDVRGFKLGTELDQIGKQFPSMNIKPPDEFGLVKLTLVNKDMGTNEVRADHKVDPAKYSGFKDIYGVELGILDGQVTSISVMYPDKGISLEDFQKRVKETYSLPDSFLNYGNTNCSGLQISSGRLTKHYDTGPGFWDRDVRDWGLYLDFSNKNAKATLEQRKDQKVKNKENAEREEREKKAREFKP